MVWLAFTASAAAIVFIAGQLAKYGDVIALRTRLGGMFIGVLLLAGATSLPELLTSISSIHQNAPNLAAGNLIGSNAFNMLLLAVLDLAHSKQRILRKAALRHALSGSLAVFLIGLVLFFTLADVRAQIGWVGLDSLIIIAAYIVAVRLIQSNVVVSHVAPDIPAGTPSLLRGAIGFALSAIAMVFVAPILVRSSAEIAAITGLGTTFIGTTLVATATSLPELVTTLAAARIGADDMAIGNLFGSNMFNIFAVGLTDLFYTQGRFLAIIDPSFMLIGMLGLLMTGLGLIGNLAKLEKRALFIEIDALVLILMYVTGIWLLYARGVTP